MESRLKKIRDWYEEHERRISTYSLLFGFIFDSLTLQRIDKLVDNLWFLANLAAAAVSIALLNRQENAGVLEEGSEKEQAKESWKHFWLFNIMQFSFGALLGGSFVFYFRSATLAVSWPFLLILLAAMVANELFQKRYARLVFQLSFFYLSLFILSIFMLPLALHRIGPDIFLLSGALSLALLWGFVLVLRKAAQEKFRQSWTLLWRSVLTIFVLVNILYFTNLIPPIPLSLKDAGIYHSVTRSAAGNYIVSEEQKGWRDYFRLRQTVRWVSGDALYAYSAIFSPGSLNTQIVHEWQYQDREGKWVTATRIPLYLSGGRSDGFRTYSTKFSLTPGAWRVNVETLRGQLIGRINFLIVSSETRAPVETYVKK